MRIVAALVLLLAVIACTPSEPLNVVAIQVGKSLNTDHSIGRHALSFRPNDTMYVSVLTAGRGAGTINVKWNFRGLEIHNVSRKVAYNDQAATDFRLQPGDELPLGDYTIEVIVDGKPIETRRVKVE